MVITGGKHSSNVSFGLFLCSTALNGWSYRAEIPVWAPYTPLKGLQHPGGPPDQGLFAGRRGYSTGKGMLLGVLECLSGTSKAFQRLEEGYLGVMWLEFRSDERFAMDRLSVLGADQG